jgi:dTDP-4-amino-4,6-dideoxygalactose transaminase
MSDDARILFGQPWFDEAEERLVQQTLRSGWIGQGPLVERFERRLAAYLGAPHVVAVSSCTAALHLSLAAAGVGPGDEVITTPFTFVATINAIEHVGATPVLVDIDPDTRNITPAAVAAAITPRTRALMPVHFAGLPVDLEAMYELADEHDLFVIEDAAHAVGAVAHGRRVGGSGHPRSLCCFSFYPNKNLASAEGGAVALADPRLDEALRCLRLHGLKGDAWDRYRTDEYRPSLAVAAGFKSNWTDLQAAIGLPQLEKLEGFLAARETLAARYDDLLAGVPGVRVLPRPRPSLATRHALHLYQVAIEAGGHGSSARDRIVQRLIDQGIGAAVHYIAVHRHPYYAERIDGRFPNAEWASDHLITLPLHMHLSDRDLVRICRALDAAVRELALASPDAERRGALSAV